MDKPLWAWGGFFALILVLLVLDLGIIHRREREISLRESLWLSVGYITLSLLFGCAVYYYLGAKDGKDFFTAYVIEKSLSMDNIFILSLVFNYFYIPRRYQHRVLFWGILGVVLLRGVMIGAGALLVTKFHAILYVFGAFLVITGLRMLFFAGEGEKSLNENGLFKWLRRKIQITASLHENKFFVRELDTIIPNKMVRKATPLFLALVFIELMDVMFAVDSIPAVFTVTTDLFVVYTSNIFAILGLRALYFALAAMLHRFTYLKYSLALVLVFIGGKIFAAPFIGDISSTVSLAVTLGLLACGVALSLLKIPRT